MANPENIKPYSDFAHKAAQHGGVDCYLNEIESASYDRGTADTLRKVIYMLPLAIPSIIAVWEGGKLLVKKGINHLDKRIKNDDIRIEEAKAAVNAEIVAIDDSVENDN